MGVRSIKVGVCAGASAGVVAIAISAGAAYACTALSTLAVSRTSSLAGAAVTLTGAGFTAKTPVVIRWNPASGTAQGPVLASLMPTSTGHFVTSITVPVAASPGEYVISTGQPSNPVLGEGAGALFEVDPATPPPARVVAPVSSKRAAVPTAKPAGTPGPAMWLLAVLSLIGAFLVGAVGLVIASLRRRDSRIVATEDAQLAPTLPFDPPATDIEHGEDDRDHAKQPVAAGSGRFPR